MNTIEWKTLVKDWRALPSDVVDVFTQYRIISKTTVDGETQHGYTEVSLSETNADGRTLGPGPLVAPDVLVKMLNACTDEKGRIQIPWLKWVLETSGGGSDARERSAKAMEQIRIRFLDEQVKGYTDSCGTFHSPVTEEEAARRWETSEPRFKTLIEVSDQDIVARLSTFGYYRHWPGHESIYERACAAASSAIQSAGTAKEWNAYNRKYRPDSAIPPFGVTQNLSQLEASLGNLKRFVDSKNVREDIRVETVYDDDNVTALIPLTYAASVAYGVEKWPYSSFKTFLQCVMEKSSWNQPWKDAHKDKQPLVFINFKVPMYSTVTLEHDKLTRYGHRNLVFHIENGAETLRDESNAYVGPNTVIGKILHGVEQAKPAPEEFPITESGQLYESLEEAESIIKSFNSALESVRKTLKSFNVSKIKVQFDGK